MDDFDDPEQERKRVVAAGAAGLVAWLVMLGIVFGVLLACAAAAWLAHLYGGAIQRML